VSGADLARNLFDVLTAIPPTPPAPSAAGGAAAAALPRLPGQAADACEAPPLASWCGAAEAGTAAAAADAGEGARRRRKRRRQEEGGADAEPSAASEGAQGARAAKGVRWASAALQRRAWSGAWLAVLRVPLPDDIFRKARSSRCWAACLGRLLTVRCLRAARGSLHAWCACAWACRTGSREQLQCGIGFGACGQGRKRVCGS